MSPALALLLAGAAAVFGLLWPDYDQWLPGLEHRSVLTHGLWLPLGLAFAARRTAWLAPVAAGAALGIAVHCAPDLFPAAMQGYALIKLPFVADFGAGLSWAWLAATVVLGIVVPLRWVEARFGATGLGIAAAAAEVLALAYFVLHDEPPAMALGVGGALALAHPAARSQLLARARRVTLARLLAARHRSES